MKYDFNRIQLKQNDIDMIKKIIIKKYKDLYPSIQIEYKKIRNIFYFQLYLNIKVFDVSNGLIEKPSLIQQYTNQEISTYFNLGLNDIYYNNNFLNQLKNDIDAIIIFYKLLKFYIKEYDIQDGKICFYIDKKHKTWFENDYVLIYYYTFDDYMDEYEYTKLIKKIKKRLNNIYKKEVKNE